MSGGKFEFLLQSFNDMLNEKIFHEIYEDFQESGLTVKAFCANRQLNEAKFYYWKRRLKEELSPKQGFIPMVFDSSTQMTGSVKNRMESGITDQGICCEISYPSGVSIKLKRYPDLSILRSLILLTH
jgi:hypothetical protein